MADEGVSNNSDNSQWLEDVARWYADNVDDAEQVKGFGFGVGRLTIGDMSSGHSVPGHGMPGHHVPGDGDGDGIPHEREAELAKRAAQSTRRFANRTTSELEDRARKHRKIIDNVQRMKKNRTARMQDTYDLDDSKRKLKMIEEELKHRRNEAEIARSAHVGKAASSADFQQDDWLENVAMWYAANFDDDLDEKGFGRSIGRALTGRGIGGHAPRVGRGSHDIDPLGGRDLEDVIDRNNDGWVFSGRWRRRASTVKPSIEKPGGEGRVRRALDKLPTRRGKVTKIDKPTGLERFSKPMRWSGLDKVSPRYRSVVGRVMDRYDSEQRIIPGNHGERHIAMLQRVDMAKTRADAKKVMAERLDEIDTRIDALNKMLERRGEKRANKARHLDEMLSLLKEREWTTHRQQQIDALPEVRTTHSVTVWPWPKSWDKTGKDRERTVAARDALRDALNSERPDRQNHRYLKRIRDNYDGQAGTSERVESIRKALEKAREDRDGAFSRWPDAADAEQDKSRAEAVAAKIRLVEALERDETDALSALDRRRTRVQLTRQNGDVKFKPLELGEKDSYLLPDDLQGLELEDAFRQQLADNWDDPYPWPHSYLKTDYSQLRNAEQIDTRIRGLTSRQTKLEAILRDKGELTASEREDYRRTLKELEKLRTRRQEALAEHMRWDGQSSSAFERDREGTPLSAADIGDLIGEETQLDDVILGGSNTDPGDFYEGSVPVYEPLTPQAKEKLEGKVVTFKDVNTMEREELGGVVVQVDPFDPNQDYENDQFGDEDPTPGTGGQIVVWVTHKNGKKLDEPYEYVITSHYDGDASDALGSMRIHGNASSASSNATAQDFRTDRRVEADLDARDN